MINFKTLMGVRKYKHYRGLTLIIQVPEIFKMVILSRIEKVEYQLNEEQYIFEKGRSVLC